MRKFYITAPSLSLSVCWSIIIEVYGPCFLSFDFVLFNTILTQVHPEVAGRQHLAGPLPHAGLPRLDMDQEGHRQQLRVGNRMYSRIRADCSQFS